MNDIYARDCALTGDHTLPTPEAPKQDVSEREAFEAWLWKAHPELSRTFEIKPQAHHAVSQMWSSWQARAALSTPAQSADAQSEREKQRIAEAVYMRSAEMASAMARHLHDEAVEAKGAAKARILEQRGIAEAIAKSIRHLAKDPLDSLDAYAPPSSPSTPKEQVG